MKQRAIGVKDSVYSTMVPKVADPTCGKNVVYQHVATATCTFSILMKCSARVSASE